MVPENPAYYQTQIGRNGLYASKWIILLKPMKPREYKKPDMVEKKLLYIKITYQVGDGNRVNNIIVKKETISKD